MRESLRASDQWPNTSFLEPTRTRQKDHTLANSIFSAVTVKVIKIKINKTVNCPTSNLNSKSRNRSWISYEQKKRKNSRARITFLRMLRSSFWDCSLNATRKIMVKITWSWICEYCEREKWMGWWMSEIWPNGCEIDGSII